MKTPFEFEKARDFGSVIGDSLQFFARNFKSFLLGFLTYAGPFLLIGMLGMISLGKQLFGFITDPGSRTIFPLSTLFLVPAFFASTVMVFAFVTAAIQKYRRTPDEPLVSGIWPDIRKHIGPTIVATLLTILILLLPSLILFGIAAAIGIAGVIVILFVWFPMLMYLLVPLSIFIVVHVLEDQPVATSLRRAFHLVKDNWWSTFFIYIVISLLAGIASYIFVIPAYIVLMVKSIGSIESGGLTAETGVWFGITYALAMLGSAFTSMYQILGVALQYFSLREQKEGVGLMRKIAALDQPEDQQYV